MFKKMIATNEQKTQIDELIAEMKAALSHVFIETDTGIKVIKPQEEKNTFLSRIRARIFSR